jgi:hypothetical protein
MICKKAARYSHQQSLRLGLFPKTASLNGSANVQKPSANDLVKIVKRVIPLRRTVLLVPVKP